MLILHLIASLGGNFGKVSLPKQGINLICYNLFKSASKKYNTIFLTQITPLLHLPLQKPQKILPTLHIRSHIIPNRNTKISFPSQ